MEKIIRFKNRQEAGEKLAKKLAKYKGQDAIIYALPRGGVAAGDEIAKRLGLPLDLVFARKIGHPLNPEFALGAVSESGHLTGETLKFYDIDGNWLEREVERQKLEIKRRRKLYLRGRPSLSAKDKIAIIVDDGVATGSTMLAAIEELKSQNPKKIVAAVPVSPSDTAEIIRSKVDEFTALLIPDSFLGAVGSYYEQFGQVSDEEVAKMMKKGQGDPLLFSFPDFKYLSNELEKLQGVTAGRFSVRRFRNEEIGIELQSDAKGQSCLILGSIAPPAEQLMEFVLLSHTLKKEGAKEVIAIMPYLAYSRQDKSEPLKSLATPWVSEVLRVSGVDEVATVDVHSQFDEFIFTIPIASVSPAQLFVKNIEKEVFKGAVVVAPDEGAIARAEDLRSAAGIKRPLVYFKKHRAGEDIISSLHGEIGPKMILVDDILDTGKTLITAADALKEEGVREIFVIATHGLFSGTLWQALWDLSVNRIYTTDSIPTVRSKASDQIRVISVAPLLRDYLRR